jgi:hypothetical protein
MGHESAPFSGVPLEIVFLQLQRNKNSMSDGVLKQYVARIIAVRRGTIHDIAGET